MASTTQQPNIWAQMAYSPPRGSCLQKTSVLSSCPCYRFMIHPLKAPTSFDCDGCGHHASFHRMENREEEEILQKWNTQRERRRMQSRIEGSDQMEEYIDLQIVDQQIDALSQKRRKIAAAPETVVDLEAEDYKTQASAGRKKRGRTER